MNFPYAPLTFVVLSLVLAPYSLGQSVRERGIGPNRSNGDPVRLTAAGIDVGTRLPEVSIFDEEGRPFETKTLRGKYSVLVFGCLT